MAGACGGKGGASWGGVKGGATGSEGQGGGRAREGDLTVAAAAAAVVQWVDIWNCLYRERIMFLSKPVDDELGNQVGGWCVYV